MTYTGVADILWKQRDGDTALTLLDNEPDTCYIGLTETALTPLKIINQVAMYIHIPNY